MHGHNKDAPEIHSPAPPQVLAAGGGAAYYLTAAAFVVEEAELIVAGAAAVETAECAMSEGEVARELAAKEAEEKAVEGGK